MGVGSGAHTGLIGEEAPLYSLAYCSLQGVAKAAANDGVGNKSILEYHGESLRHILYTAYEQYKSPKDIQSRHHRNHFLRDTGNSLYTAQENEYSHQSHHQPHYPGGDTEGSAACLAYGV